MEDVRAGSDRSAARPDAPADAELSRRQEGLRLQRSRIVQELELARNPRYRKLLEDMLSHIERQLN